MADHGKYERCVTCGAVEADHIQQQRGPVVSVCAEFKPPCRYCGGSGWTEVGTAKGGVPCVKCEGTGRGPRKPATTMSEMLGLDDPTAITRHHAEINERIFIELIGATERKSGAEPQRPEPPDEVTLWHSGFGHMYNARTEPPAIIGDETYLGIYVPAAKAEAERDLEKQARETAARTVVYIVGGIVEGLPTQTINVLQRLRELVAIEKESDALKAKVARLRKALRPYARGSSSDCCNPESERCGTCSRCVARAALAPKS